ncbi:MAG: winged helix-turn-helix transcriptional regulator [Eubacteriaceae bacterium]|nr:winged helix-turn-helix transcriptional regulator [Eubacteriaceae bacterium]
MIEIFKALGDENRLRILNILKNYELCVCELEVILEISQSNASRHLAKLKNVGIITASKDGQWVHYQLSKKFAEKNKPLLEYLEAGFQSNEIFENDLNRYVIYKDSEYNCQTITNDKDLVTKYIDLKSGGIDNE